MSDVEINPLCPQCGAPLHLEQIGPEPQAEDRVFCPTHGTIGTREEIGRQAVEQATPEISKKIGSDLFDALKKGGFDVSRE